MKEENKKFKFKKWYLMPIFIFVFLCVFGFSIVKPVKAEYYTENPTFAGNTQYSFNIQLENSLVGDNSIMLPNEVYNYTENSNISSPINTAIAVVNDSTGEVDPYGYIEQSHTFFYHDNNFSFNTYSSRYHFISMFTSVDNYLNFVNEEFIFIPSNADSFSNFDYSIMPYFANSMIEISNIENRQYLKFVSCSFDYVEVSNTPNGIREITIPYTYDFQEDITGFNNLSLSYNVNNEEYPIFIPNTTGSIGSILYPFRLVDYLTQEFNNNYSRDMCLIRNFTINCYIPPATQVTGIDKIFTLYTPITKNLNKSIERIDYQVENPTPITLLSNNLTSADWAQLEITRLNAVNVEVDTTSWLITAVGAFMNAELFPGFAIGGIFAVMVSFPLVIWFLKVVLGG